MLSRLEAAAKRALGHRDLQWVMKHVPREYADNPTVIRELLASAVDGDPDFAASPAFRDAHAALLQVADVRDLRDRVGALCANPYIQAAVADRGLDYWLARPELAYKTLIEIQASDPKFLPDAVFKEALECARGAADAVADFGIAEAPVTSAPIPADTARQEHEYRELIGRSLDGRLTHAEEQRLDALAWAKAGREEAAVDAHAATLTARPTAPGEYEKLISKSNTGQLSAAERGRLADLAEARAVDQGLIPAEPDNTNVGETE